MSQFIRYSLATALIGLATTAHAGVESSGDSGFHIKLTQPVDLSAQQAYQRFVADVDKWWLNEHTWFGDASKLSIEAKATGCFCEVNENQQAEHMRVSYVDPNKKLALVGGLGPLQGLGMSGTMTITFSDQSVTLEYIVGGYPTTDFTQLAPIVDSVLEQQLASFARLK